MWGEALIDDRTSRSARANSNPNIWWHDHERSDIGSCRLPGNMFGGFVKVRVPPAVCPRQDSNLRTALRRRVLYPLSYEGSRGECSNGVSGAGPIRASGVARAATLDLS